jgi:hypothetical protein
MPVHGRLRPSASCSTPSPAKDGAAQRRLASEDGGGADLGELLDLPRAVAADELEALALRRQPGAPAVRGHDERRERDRPVVVPVVQELGVGDPGVRLGDVRHVLTRGDEHRGETVRVVGSVVGVAAEERQLPAHVQPGAGGLGRRRHRRCPRSRHRPRRLPESPRRVRALPGRLLLQLPRTRSTATAPPIWSSSSASPIFSSTKTTRRRARCGRMWRQGAARGKRHSDVQVQPPVGLQLKCRGGGGSLALFACLGDLRDGNQSP